MIRLLRISRMPRTFSTASAIFSRRARSPLTAAYPQIAAVPGGCERLGVKFPNRLGDCSGADCPCKIANRRCETERIECGPRTSLRDQAARDRKTASAAHRWENGLLVCRYLKPKEILLSC